MTIWYLDPSVAVNGVGSIISPFNTPASIVIAAGDSILLQRGTTWRGQFPSAALAANNLQVGAYGVGSQDRPKVCGSTAILGSQLSTTAYSGVYSYTLAGNTGGHVAQSGSVLNHVVFASVAVTVANLAAGQFTVDPATFTTYLRPASFTPTTPFEVSSELFGLIATGVYSGLEISEIELTGQSRNGFQFYNRSFIKLHHCTIRNLGGHAYTTTLVGNGVEIANGCYDFDVFENDCYDIFDAAISPQIYTTNDICRRGKVHHNRVYRCGFQAIEMTITLSPTNATLADIDIYNNLVVESGYGWRATTVTGKGITVGCSAAGNTLSNIRIFDNILIDCRWAIAVNNRNTGTSNGIEIFGNIARTIRSPSNGHGLYLNGDVKVVGNIFDGYNYGVEVYGTSAVTRTVILQNNLFANTVKGIVKQVSDGGFNGTTLVGRNNVWMLSSNLIENFGANLQFDLDYEQITSGISVSGTAIGANTTRLTDAALLIDAAGGVPLTSPLVASGVHVGYNRGLGGRVFYNPPTKGPFEAVRDRALAVNRIAI